MISLPPGFNVAAFIADVVALVVYVSPLIALVSVYGLIKSIIRRAS